ncbi:MAG: Rieske 2Fe-2S domain-containing protein [Planctomycetota bacterium]
MIRTLSPPQPVGTSASGLFCNPGQTVQSWYVAMPSRRLRRGKVVGVDMLGRRIAFWRDNAGDVHAVDAACPHLGADLSLGDVIDGGLRCPFHHWRIGPDGACVDAPCERRTPNRSTRSYPVAEMHGLIWVFNGPTPSFEIPTLPEDDDPKRYRRVRVPPLHLNCHPHLALANGLDVTHFDKLHGLTFTSEPTLEQVDGNRLRVTISGRPPSRWVQAITRTRRADVEAVFTTIGPSIAWLTFTRPLRFHAVFTARPDANGQTDTQTFLYLPGFGFKALRCAATLLCVLHADRPVLNSIKFKPGFVESDKALSLFARMINQMEPES